MPVFLLCNYRKPNIGSPFYDSQNLNRIVRIFSLRFFQDFLSKNPYFSSFLQSAIFECYFFRKLRLYFPAICNGKPQKPGFFIILFRSFFFRWKNYWKFTCNRPKTRFNAVIIDGAFSLYRTHV